MTRRNMLISWMIAMCSLAGTAFAQKASVPKVRPAKATLENENVRELLLQMDTDKDGKISKQEWMKFMEAEFDRLDRDKSGTLNRQELLQSKLLVRNFHFSDVGK
ncbi:MAG TPA: hypothetical protein VFN26_05845 [Candidatus Acidoferrum sp.]|nr:hypothetical protein [Candidatus Acidoferrum sp.]